MWSFTNVRLANTMGVTSQYIVRTQLKRVCEEHGAAAVAVAVAVAVAALQILFIQAPPFSQSHGGRSYPRKQTVCARREDGSLVAMACS